MKEVEVAVVVIKETVVIDIVEVAAKAPIGAQSRCTSMIKFPFVV